MGLNNRVQMYRWKKKWSEEQLSRAAGVSRSVICKLENGANVNPTAEVAFRLADALDVDVRELFYYKCWGNLTYIAWPWLSRVWMR